MIIVPALQGSCGDYKANTCKTLSTVLDAHTSNSEDQERGSCCLSFINRHAFVGIPVRFNSTSPSLQCRQRKIYPPHFVFLFASSVSYSLSKG